MSRPEYQFELIMYEGYSERTVAKGDSLEEILEKVQQKAGDSGA